MTSPKGFRFSDEVDQRYIFGISFKFLKHMQAVARSSTLSTETLTPCTVVPQANDCLSTLPEALGKELTFVCNTAFIHLFVHLTLGVRHTWVQFLTLLLNNCGTKKLCFFPSLGPMSVQRTGLL